jgi:hypothetical protein
MLKQEERRLRAEDTIRVKERTSRLQMKIKMKILEQQQMSTEAYNTYKKRQNIQV